eukprot:maker-scaffold153_size302544-snap-gene-0.8 protein:Tk03367 transcript:maker-scaffold153_size302544-snap-gene-0.8-mRNA-1 annotation:"hypothetical protein KGM_17840"
MTTAPKATTGSGSGFGLEEIGIPGRDFLREALTSCTDPLKAIEDFQIENGILLPSLRPMLPMLDLHGIKRLDFHNSVLEDLRDKLIQQIQGQASGLAAKERERKLKELLVKSFPVIKIKPLRPVVMSVLKQMSFIEDRYLQVLVRDQELYEDCDIVIKRHLWRDNQSLFGDEVSPHLSNYIRDKENALYRHESPNHFFALSPKGRRQLEVIQKLADMIGHNVKLYDMTLQFLRTLFLRTRNVHYCTLRAELLMALHELEVQDIISVDPCHKFTWCLDACIRERNVDVKRSRELQGFLDAIRRGQEQVLGDLSMTLCDPFAINFLASSALKIMNHQVERDGMPRENAILHLLLRMLVLGLSAWEMIETQEFAEPKLDTKLVTRFIPALMSLIVDDQVRAQNNKLPVEDRAAAQIVIEHSGPPPEAYQNFIGSSLVATTLAMHYTLQTAKAKDTIGLKRVLGYLANVVHMHPYEDPFMHTLVTYLIQMKDEFDAKDFGTCIFDEFFFTSINNDNFVRHLLRLLWFVYSKVDKTRLENILKLTEPAAFGTPEGANDPMTQEYTALKEKIEAHLEALAASQANEEGKADQVLENV